MQFLYSRIRYFTANSRGASAESNVGSSMPVNQSQGPLRSHSAKGSSLHVRDSIALDESSYEAPWRPSYQTGQTGQKYNPYHKTTKQHRRASNSQRSHAAVILLDQYLGPHSLDTVHCSRQRKGNRLPATFRYQNKNHPHFCDRM